MIDPTPSSPDNAGAEALRQKAERSRQSAEQDRQRAEGDRQLAERTRVASEGKRAEVLETVAGVADTLQATLTQMKVVEDLRRNHTRQNR